MGDAIILLECNFTDIRHIGGGNFFLGLAQTISSTIHSHSGKDIISTIFHEIDETIIILGNSTSIILSFIGTVVFFTFHWPS